MRRPWRTKKEQPIELRLPSRLGYEKVAMDTVALIAERMGFGRERIDGLRTAVSEAVTNAIEHGNSGLRDAEVHVVVQVCGSKLVVSVRDQHYRQFDRQYGMERPDIGRAFQGEEVGLGMWLIRQFVDEVEYTAAPNGGNEVRMVLHRNQ
jgi:serine/threonine-protein kinase RsbW